MTTTVFTNMTVWTGERNDVVEGHVTVVDGRVTSVAPGAYRAAYGGADDVVDLAGGFLMPAFGDGHAHPVFGALEELGPRIKGAKTVDEIVKAVADYALAHPGTTPVLGASYSPTLTTNGVFDATWLDCAVNDRPVVLRATDYHTVWCNTEALRRAGITATTPDPPLGEIVRRPDGTPYGTLREWDACEPVLALIPPPTSAELRRAVREAGRTCASMGLTWVLDAWVDVDTGLLEAYLDEAATGTLGARFDLSLRADPRRWREQRHVFHTHRDRAAAALSDGAVRANTVKFFADGTVESGTALLLADYCDSPHNHGIAVWDPAELRDAITAFDADGFHIHIHAIGDGGVRMALDAIEHAQRNNAPWDRRPVITHIQLVSNQDLARFAALGVIANFQPYWAHHDDFQRLLTEPRLGERSTSQYQIASMLASGAQVSFGSDWPVSTLHPMEGIGVAVTRAVDGDDTEPWLPEECLTVSQSLRIYTAGATYQAGADRHRGIIAPGMTADLIWLSENPFDIAPKDLASVLVLGTWLAGCRTYSAHE
jgi:predicted amidohydrolase YtcJ